MHFNIISLVVSQNYAQFLAPVSSSFPVLRIVTQIFSISVLVSVYNNKFRSQTSGATPEIGCLYEVTSRVQNNSHKNKSYFNKFKPK
jgi:uncharacterized membrane protein